MFFQAHFSKIKTKKIKEEVEVFLNLNFSRSCDPDLSINNCIKGDTDMITNNTNHYHLEIIVILQTLWPS